MSLEVMTMNEVDEVSGAYFADSVTIGGGIGAVYGALLESTAAATGLYASMGMAGGAALASGYVAGGWLNDYTGWGDSIVDFTFDSFGW